MRVLYYESYIESNEYYILWSLTSLRLLVIINNTLRGVFLKESSNTILTAWERGVVGLRPELDRIVP